MVLLHIGIGLWYIDFRRPWDERGFWVQVGCSYMKFPRRHSFLIYLLIFHIEIGKWVKDWEAQPVKAEWQE